MQSQPPPLRAPPFDTGFQPVPSQTGQTAGFALWAMEVKGSTRTVLPQEASCNVRHACGCAIQALPVEQRGKSGNNSAPAAQDEELTNQGSTCQTRAG